MRFSQCAILLVVAMGVVGCAGTGTRPDRSAPDEAYLAERAVERWNLLINGGAAEAYDYLSPGYRSIRSRESYVADIHRKPMTWTSVEPMGVECPPEAGYCDVTLNIRFKVRSGSPMIGRLESASPLTERWILSGKDWYFVPKEVARR
jgi:hypothetical protein